MDSVHDMGGTDGFGKVEVENSSNGQYAVVSCNGDLF